MSRLRIDDAEHANGFTIEEQRHASVRGDAELLDRGVVLEDGVLARVANDERFTRLRAVMAERVAQRGLPARGPGLAEPYGALEELSARVDQRDERDRALQEVRRETREDVELGLRRGVEELGASQRGESARVLRHGSAKHRRWAPCADPFSNPTRPPSQRCSEESSAVLGLHHRRGRRRHLPDGAARARLHRSRQRAVRSRTSAARVSARARVRVRRRGLRCRGRVTNRSNLVGARGRDGVACSYGRAVRRAAQQTRAFARRRICFLVSRSAAAALSSGA